MTRWTVRAEARSRRTGVRVGEPRDEAVDSSNPIFRGCRTLEDVRAAYEGFWADGEDVVIVLDVWVMP